MAGTTKPMVVFHRRRRTSSWPPHLGNDWNASVSDEIASKNGKLPFLMLSTRHLCVTASQQSRGTPTDPAVAATHSPSPLPSSSLPGHRHPSRKLGHLENQNFYILVIFPTKFDMRNRSSNLRCVHLLQLCQMLSPFGGRPPTPCFDEENVLKGEEVGLTKTGWESLWPAWCRARTRIEAVTREI